VSQCPINVLVVGQCPSVKSDVVGRPAPDLRIGGAFNYAAKKRHANSSHLISRITGEVPFTNYGGIESLHWLRKGAGMTEDQLGKMRECARRLEKDAKTVRVTCNDGDVLQGFALFVSDAERDVIFQLHSSNNPGKYQSGTHYLINWDDISDFQELT
jgi:hypothetical protein